jgi:hypothetical protein
LISAAGIADRIRRLESLTLALSRDGQWLRAGQDPQLVGEDETDEPEVVAGR